VWDAGFARNKIPYVAGSEVFYDEAVIAADVYAVILLLGIAVGNEYPRL
jgi:hypothetical protein